jgi:hypothetical protein
VSLTVIFGHLAAYSRLSFAHRFGVRLDRLGRTFRFAHATIDALVGMDDEHVLASIEAVDRANLHAVHILALDAVLGDDVGHDIALVTYT